MLPTLLVVVFGSLLPPGTLLAQDAPFLGRWVSLDGPMNPPVVVFEAGGAFLSLMPAPNFLVHYQADGDRLVLRGQGSDETMVFFLRGETLEHESGGTMDPVEGAGPSGDGGHGTWRSSMAEGMPQFWTFRSDGVVALEVGTTGEWTAGEGGRDGSSSLSIRGTVVNFRFELVGDTLHLTREGSEPSRLVRRPWGCFGAPDEETQAEECH